MLKRYTQSDDPSENYYPTVLFPFSSTERFTVFQFVVLVLWSATLLFEITQTAPVVSRIRQLPLVKSNSNSPTVCPLPSISKLR